MDTRPFAIGARVVDLHDHAGTVVGYYRDNIAVEWDEGGTSSGPISHGGLRPEPKPVTLDAARCVEEGEHKATQRHTRSECPTSTMTTTLPLSSEAYAAESFDDTIDRFRDGMPEDFAFTITPDSYIDRNGTVAQRVGLCVTTNDADYAARIIAALEGAVR